jgi:hypothetical protein
MKRLRCLASLLAALTLALTGIVGADDGQINNKSMSQTIKVPDFDDEIVDNTLSEAEHAFTGFMKFYVPAQQASGAPAGKDVEDGLVVYNNIEELEVEALPVARPLVNVFIYGPQFEVENTAFAHRYFDTYVAVSLDDGVTFKQTNLSNSAAESSFDLVNDTGTSDGDGDGDGDVDFIPHTVNRGGVLHVTGLDDPYYAPNHCSECHGVALQGNTQAPSCYSCHEAKWDTPPELGAIITKADFIGGTTLDIAGFNVGINAEVTILNAETGHLVGDTVADSKGDFLYEEELNSLPPCVVHAQTTDSNGNTQIGAAVTVKEDGVPVKQCVGTEQDLNAYPGGTYNVFHAIAGNKVLVAWPSRFCSKGQPAYNMTVDEPTEDALLRLETLEDFLKKGDKDLGVDRIDFSMDEDLYLLDAFGVAGKQGYVDFADEGYPQAGIVPYGCVWTARGILLPGDDPRTEDNVEQSHFVWTQAERLTSGRRDPNRIEVRAVKDAGFVMTWQEDPDGLRPGQGLGPGEGWSGAVAHSQTDVWYSFINYEYFDLVESTDDPTIPVNVLDHDLTLSGRPQVFMPMAVPMRMTNNAKCNAPDETGLVKDDLYCDFELAEPYGIKNQCADTITILTGNPDSDGGQKETEMCVVDTDGDGSADLPNRANTAATRPRLSLQGYTDAASQDKSAWVVFAVEESKGLGASFFLPDSDGDGFAELCAEGDDYPCSEELGKNQWYHSFDMGTPDTSAGIGLKNSLVENLVSQGNMLNQGEVHWETGELVGLMSTSIMGADGGSLYGDYDFDILNTEIARRASLLVQGIGKANESSSKLLALPSWKQGPMRQGGPADTMIRRIAYEDCIAGNDTAEVSFSVMATDEDHKVDICHLVNEEKDKWIDLNVDMDSLGGHLDHGDFLGTCEEKDNQCEIPQTIEINPYSFEFMVCDEFLIEPETNPYYPGGVCADPAINLSSVVPDTCLDDDTGSLTDCPTVDFTDSTYGIGDTNPILQGVVQGEGNKTRVLTWHQCPSDGTVLSSDGVTPVDCDSDARDDDFVNLRDQSWYNPLDVSKGHRGFIDGDFVMFLYAWSPNWRLNAKGNDRYELYVRRSFDGAETFTTTPSTFRASDGMAYMGDGTVTCESYRRSETGGGNTIDEPKACYEFGAGGAEHARNITQHKSMRITTLDPRYAISGSPTGVGIDETCTDGLFLDDSVIDGIFTCDDTSEVMDTDLRDPSRYFMVFETGDNTTVVVGEAEPLDLFYGRAESFGDDYTVWTETDTETGDPLACYPSDPHAVLDVSDVIIGSGFCNEFDNMNTGGDTHSSEASLAGTADGSKLYAVWAQWVFDEDGEEVVESDAKARRLWWIDDYIAPEADGLSYTLPGTK